MNMICNDKSLKLLEFQVEASVQSTIIWNSFPGSVLHGALGFTVKHRTCIAKDEKCETCFLQDECIYPPLFESRVPDDSQRMRKYPRIPPGLRLTIDPWCSSKVNEGDRICIGVTLFGNAIDTAGLFLLSIEDCLTQGIGRKSEGGNRGTAEIISISATNGTQYLWRGLDFTEPFPVEAKNWREIAELDGENFEMEFTSPTRIMSKGHITANPSFKDIFSTTLRRITNIAYFYCGIELEADFKGLVKKADDVVYKSNFRRSEHTRYSARQKKRMEFDGIIGKMSINDCPKELIEWILIGAKLGIGKNTSMGMGSYVVKY